MAASTEAQSATRAAMSAAILNACAGNSECTNCKALSLKQDELEQSLDDCKCALEAKKAQIGVLLSSTQAVSQGILNNAPLHRSTEFLQLVGIIPGKHESKNRDELKEQGVGTATGSRNGSEACTCHHT